MEVQVTIDGETYTVKPENLSLPDGAQLIGPDESPDGFVKRSVMEKEVDKAKDGLRKTEEIIGDDDLFIRAAKRRGYEVNEDGELVVPNSDDGPDIDEIEERFENERLQPVKKEKEKAESRAQMFMRRALRGSLVEAGKKAGVKDYLLTAPENGSVPPIVRMFGDEFAYDEEHDKFALQKSDGDGFEYASDPSEGDPYAGPEDFLQRLRSQEEYSDMFKDNRPGETGLGDTNGQGSGGQRTFKRSELANMSDEEFEKHEDEIMDAMERGDIIDDT